MNHFPATLNPTAQEFRPTNTPPYYTYSYPFNFYNPVPPPVYVAPPPLPPPSTAPTRTLLLSSVPHGFGESLIRRDLEVFGDVRAVQMEKIRDGIVTVHFYDIRKSMEALHVIQEQHMQQQCRLRKHFEGLTLVNTKSCVPPWNYLSPPVPPPAVGLIGGKAVWAQFTFPVASVRLPDGYNQGTIVVFNLDPDVDTQMLKEIFEAYGCVKELRGTPSKKNQMFIEFYDTRDASKALRNMNGKEINGKPVVVEFSRPGGHKYSPKHNRLNPVCSVRPPPGILARKYGTESGPYRPSQPPTPPAMPLHCVTGSSKGGKGQSGNAVDFFRATVKKAGKKQVEQLASSSVWTKQRKGFRQMREKYDPRFLIKEDGIISGSYFSDARTTVMIKNIPNKYSQKLLLNMLDNHCIHCNEQITAGSSSDGGTSGGEQPLSSYDFVYLPIDFMNKCNVGYAFVNMTSPEATWRLYKAFHHQNWEAFNSKKICEVSYARLQGLEALKDHFKNSRFPCEAEEYMPVRFSPPRDGWIVTDPAPITAWTNFTTSIKDMSSTEEGKSCNSSSNDDYVAVVSDNSCNNSSTNCDDAVASYGGVSGGDD